MITPQELIDRVLQQADFDDCIVLVEQTSQANLRWANSTLTTNGMIASRKVTVLAFTAVEGGMAVGAATRANLELDEIAGVLREAGDNAKAAGLADDFAPLLQNYAHGDWAAGHLPTTPEVFSAVVPALGDVFQRSVADGIELFGYAEHTIVTTWLGSKNGLRLRYDQPAGRIEMTGKSHERSRSTWEGRATRDFSNIDVADIDQLIRQRLDWQARKVELPAGRYDTVAPAGVVGDILCYALFSADGRSAHEGRSAFAKRGGGTRIGEKLANLPINLYSDPNYPGLETTPFMATSESGGMASVFDNGQPVDRLNVLSDGVLTSLIQTRATAALMSQPFTPIGGNTILELPGAAGGPMDLVAGMDSGLLLSTVWYIREVDPVTLLLTGLTRDGVYQVKGGEVVAAVNNYRFNESPIELLGRMDAVGETGITQLREWSDYIDRVAFPAVRFKDFNMSTVSQAN